ncbi:UPF0182 family protein [Geitlerinema sp. PCC 9228]|jgi:hypothetical protein|uniref:UPF0182 family protein n=1 Tax=Geitlerinema sp. PCC 9228 TaxID=111611 RepID=UPI0008F99487|nr:UPF0182 family protein [Geitlerinema sp. PCC 9228]
MVKATRSRRLVIWLALLVFAGVVAVDLTVTLVAEGLWFQQVRYLEVFQTRVATRVVLWVVVALASGAFLWGNLSLASRWESQPPATEKDLPDGSALKFRWLLASIVALSFLVGIVLLHYGQVMVASWTMPADTPTPSWTPLPTPLGFRVLWQDILTYTQHWWSGVALMGITLALIAFPHACLSAIAVVFALGLAWLFSQHWSKVLLFSHPVDFGTDDPIFHLDVGFYLFQLPFWELLEFWLLGLFLYGTVAVALIYLRQGNSLGHGRFVGISPLQKRHLQVLGGCLLSAIALSHWLERYQMLNTQQGVTYGANYTTANVLFPIYFLLTLVALLLAGLLFWRAWFAKRQISDRHRHEQPKSLPTSKPWKKRFSIPIFALGFVAYIGMAVGSIFLPIAVERLVVQPNELEREQPYIEHNIAFTRQAFALDQIDAETFQPAGQLTYEELMQDQEMTVSNIRLWDKRPLLATNRQLQQIRLYYAFPDADVDRYTIKRMPTPEDPRQTEKQQVFLSARELDYQALPSEAQRWVNRHLIYTHGYGFTMSPVNTVAPSGLPDYYVKDIGIPDRSANTPENVTTLGTSSERIRASIPIGQPRIYYGELTDPFVMAPSRVKELDYPSGNENVYNNYDGRGGVSLGSLWRRWLYAQYFNNWQIVLTQNLTPQTRLLFHRNIRERVQAIAPFLRYDSDPYMVVADANLYPQENDSEDKKAHNYLYWVIDAYTTSNYFPYSDPGEEEFNYIRNSVKVVVDAYNGDVVFYVADEDDPIVQSWQQIFPNLFQPLSEMPVTLSSHIRYPVDFFSIQSQRLLTYHMTDPQVFYNREDQWRIPSEIYAGESRPVAPYYLIMRLPTATSEEFILLSPFTPQSRNNLVGWLAARSDSDRYGKLLLYQFPKQELVYGPEQIEARINQDPVISEQISLWNRQGSRVIQGNLLVIPVEQSLLYVEPLYLEAEQTSLPTLARVIVVSENRIAMAETLDEALKAVFQSEQTTAPPIIRPVEEIAPPLTEQEQNQQN